MNKHQGVPVHYQRCTCGHCPMELAPRQVQTWSPDDPETWIKKHKQKAQHLLMYTFSRSVVNVTINN